MYSDLILTDFETNNWYPYPISSSGRMWQLAHFKCHAWHHLLTLSTHHLSLLVLIVRNLNPQLKHAPDCNLSPFFHSRCVNTPVSPINHYWVPGLVLTRINTPWEQTGPGLRSTLPGGTNTICLTGRDELSIAVNLRAYWRPYRVR